MKESIAITILLGILFIILLKISIGEHIEKRLSAQKEKMSYISIYSSESGAQLYYGRGGPVRTIHIPKGASIDFTESDGGRVVIKNDETD